MRAAGTDFAVFRNHNDDAVAVRHNDLSRWNEVERGSGAGDGGGCFALLTMKKVLPSMLQADCAQRRGAPAAQAVDMMKVFVVGGRAGEIGSECEWAVESGAEVFPISSRKSRQMPGKDCV